MRRVFVAPGPRTGGAWFAELGLLGVEIAARGALLELTKRPEETRGAQRDARWRQPVLHAVRRDRFAGTARRGFPKYRHRVKPRS